MPLHTLHREGRRYSINDYPVSSSVVAIPSPAAPAPSTSNLIYWLRADSLALSNNARVTEWYDVDTGLNHTASAGVPYAPKYLSSFINGKPVVAFVTASTNGCCMTASNLSSSNFYAGANFSATVGCECFIVGTVHNTTAHPGYFMNWGGDRTINNNIPYDADARYRTTFGLTTGEGGFFNCPSASNMVAPFIWQECSKTGFYMSTVNSHSYNPITTNLTAAMSAPSAGKTAIGACTGDGGVPNEHSHTGSIAEILYYNKVLTTAERAATFTYLSNKYNIALG